MSELRESLLKTVKRNLDTLGLKYAIQLEDGRVVGELKLVSMPAKLNKNGKPSDPNPYSSYELRPIVAPYLQDLEPGREIHIPAGRYEVKYFARAVSVMCNELFGRGMYSTKSDETGVNVMRMKIDTSTFDWGITTQGSLNL